jgi:hypothetical protein
MRPQQFWFGGISSYQNDHFDTFSSNEAPLFLPFRSTFDVLTSERFLDSKKIRHSSTSLEGN